MRGIPGSLWLALGGLLICHSASAEEIATGGATIEIAFAPGPIDLPRADVLAWISNAADAVSTYFGRFPVPHARILVQPVEGRGGVFHGTTYGGSRGAFTRISLGQGTTQQQLHGDWMMTHELTHMAFPDVEGSERQHHWMEEGMATYIEPVARAQMGQLTVERVWGDMVRDIPQGLPKDGDQGLDHTPTWGRTYWGGALFFLLADVGIRQQTHNRKGLQDAMRGIVEAGGNILQDWPVEQVLQAGDKATGSHVLAELYQQMKATPVHTDLADLWRRLGVQVEGDVVSFNDQAPLADIRKAITARRDAKSRE